MQVLGRWAVTEHNKLAHDRIKFIRQLVSGDNNMAPLDKYYNLIIDALNSGGKDAKLKDEAW
ncbi:hypothetical protein EJB05_53309, partial [Eragrostis curvula]